MAEFTSCLLPDAVNVDHQVITPSGGLSSDMFDLVMGIIPYIDLEIGHDGIYSTLRFVPDLDNFYCEPDLDSVYKFEGARGIFLDANHLETTHQVTVFLDFNGEVKNQGMSCGTIRMWPLTNPK